MEGDWKKFSISKLLGYKRITLSLSCMWWWWRQVGFWVFEYSCLTQKFCIIFLLTSWALNWIGVNKFLENWQCNLNGKQFLEIVINFSTMTSSIFMIQLATPPSFQIITNYYTPSGIFSIIPWKIEPETPSSVIIMYFTLLLENFHHVTRF